MPPRLGLSLFERFGASRRLNPVDGLPLSLCFDKECICPVRPRKKRYCFPWLFSKVWTEA